MKKKSNKKSVVTTVAVIAAIVGAAVAVYTFLKKKAGDIGKQLDYDGNVYYEEDDDVEEDGLYSNEDADYSDSEEIVSDAAYADAVPAEDEPEELDEDTDRE